MRIKRIQQVEKIKDNVSSDIDLALLNPVIKKFKNKKGNLIPILQNAQNLYGYIPEAVFRRLAHETGLKINDMYGVATFYAQFRLKPVGKHIVRVCHGTACHVQNAVKVTDDLINYLNVKDGETTEDRIFTLETVACLGCCSLAPVMMIGDETYGKLSGKKATDIVKDIKRKEVAKNKDKQIVNISNN
jgi:NADH-quinone oxidoreductase subunit E